MSERDSRHGKVTMRWCDHCATLLLSGPCSRCGSVGREFEVSKPGDIRPALSGGFQTLRDEVEAHFGCGEAVNGLMVFFNKIAGEDRVDEVVIGGRVIGALRFDVLLQKIRLDLNIEGALLLFEKAKKGVVKLAQLSGHLQGKSVPGSEIKAIEGEFSAGDPLIALTGNLVCAASARTSSREARMADKAIRIRGAGNADGAWEAGKSDERVFVEANADHLAKLESKGVSDIKSFAKQGRAPLTVSFSGGKDSLAAYALAKKAMKEVTLIFVNTGLEFPETVEYVRRFAGKHGDKLMVADAGNAFWENVETFGPPAKDFRWCCKVCKLAPLTDLIERTYPEGTTTV
ncbi:MAG: phosphoadenosine phosphosulfate reductase family protein, partial [Methanomassiliicoccales archaeon]|nr:phosphoadenosine phosphosulfate reductase family protein [Methanomassiliicoccales archaeon]